MDKPDLQAEPYFSQPIRQVVLMLAVLGLSIAGAFVALPRVLPVFESNPELNGFIFFVFVIGVLACFWQVVQLMYSVRWIMQFAKPGDQGMRAKAPLLLAPLATLLGRHDRRMQINTAYP